MAHFGKFDEVLFGVQYNLMVTLPTLLVYFHFYLLCGFSKNVRHFIIQGAISLGNK